MEYFISTVTVENPTHDKRCRYGMESLAEIKQGTKFYVQEVMGAPEMKLYTSINGKLRKLQFHSEHNSSTIDQMKLVPFIPTALDRFDAELACGGGEVFFFRKLLEKGIVTFDQLLKIDDEYRAENL